MKRKLIQVLKTLPVAGLMLLFGGHQAQASHAQGADLTYVNIGPNMYVVKYNLYRDCSGIPANPNETLTYRAPGCSTSSQTLALSGISQTVGNPYCNNIVAGCTSSGLANYEEHTYTGTLTLPTSCGNWLLSCRIGNRNASRTLSNGTSEYLYTEAMIDNIATQSNSSPNFGKLPVPYVSVDRTITYNHGVIDPDGDSLVYSLKPAQSDMGVPVVYATYPAGVSPAGTAYPAGTFTATNPIISQQPVSINPSTGSISFHPLSYFGPNTPSSDGKDKYVVVVQVDEYRKINGVVTKIGHVRRDIMITVIDCGPNQLPYISTFRVGGQTFQNNSVLPVAAGVPVTISLDAIDDNLANLVTLTSNVTDALPGATFTVTGGARPTGTITWTPTAAQMRSAPYFLNITATDNACPVKGFQTYTLGLRVNNTGGINGVSKSLAAGSFIAFPNPSDGSEVTFKITSINADKNAEVVIYNVTGKVIDRIAVRTGEEQITWHKKTDLPAGVYLARYISASGAQTIKLVHQQ